MVEYGLSKCYYYCDNYTAPVNITGAVSLKMEKNVELFTQKRGGNTVTLGLKSDNGYTLSLEFYQLPLQFVQDVLGYSINADGVVFDSKSSIKRFTLLFETKSEPKPIRHKIVNCYCLNPDLDVTTISDSLAISTKKIKLYSDWGICKNVTSLHQYTTQYTTQEVYDNWFNF